ncbi:MAG: electron transport complex subunit E [Pseudomonadales bacterium]|jgi:electron transport complex protein RnfE|nr:electron transport complex subunit E [Pseudomonadales bacterium]
MNALQNPPASAGLWRNNPALVQLLGLCPLLAVSNATVTALALGLCTLGVLLGSSLGVSLLRGCFTPATRLSAYVLIIAAFTTCADLLLQACAYTLHQRLGIFVPLIVSNCLILGRAESFASKQPPLPALRDALLMGLGFTAVLLTLGMIREVLGTGHLFADMALLLPFAANWQMTWFDTPPFPLALLPPGAFLLLGCLIAFKNRIDQALAPRLPAPTPDSAPTGSKRVRVTGQL